MSIVEGPRLVAGEADLAELVALALDQKTLDGVSRILQRIAEMFDAYGCIIWEVSPFSDFGKGPQGARLFAMAQWFPGRQICAIHNLPMSSVAGETILSGHPHIVADWRLDYRPAESSFLEKLELYSFCSLPLSFIDGKRGALNLYRQGKVPFTVDCLETIKRAALLVPRLYNSVRNTVSLQLLSKVTDLLRNAQARVQKGHYSPSSENVRGFLGAVSHLVKEAFQCLEVSLILEVPDTQPVRFEVLDTTWPSELGRQTYRASSNDGLTGWALKHCKSVVIFDLATFEQDRSEIRQRYPGISWRDHSHVQEMAREHLPRDFAGELPPLSLIVAPILLGGRAAGAIRCSLPEREPFHLGEREAALLQIIANQLGQFWSDLRTRSIMHDENEAWRLIVQSLSQLNHFAYRELSREQPEEKRIFAEALRITQSAIPGAEIMDIRLLDPATNELYFVEIAGSAWTLGTSEEVADRRNRRFLVGNGKPRSAGEWVFRNREVRVVAEPQKDLYYLGIFPEARHCILAPIQVADSVFGVLDIRGTGERPFTPHSKVMTELLGNQLGLYHHLAATIGRLRTAEKELRGKVDELKDTREKESQTFEDLAHQLKSPIFLAYTRAQDTLSLPSLPERLRSSLLALRGLAGKAVRVVQSVTLFSDLARERPLRQNIALLQQFDVLKLLQEAVEDQQFHADPERRLYFELDRGSFYALRSHRLYLDKDLLGHAIGNLLDNAVKYSFPSSTIRIYGGITGSGRFHISVTNEGLPIRSKEIGEMKRRGWRSDEARLTTGEGSGIGLWITDHIMTAHGGDLVIAPTDSQSRNDIKLVFRANFKPGVAV